LLDPKRTVQIGIRGAQNSDEGWTFSLESGMRVVFMEEFTEMGVAAVIAEARRVVGDGPTYVSFDVDGLDPVYAPGTGTPEVGGLTTIEAQLLLRGLRGLDLVGGDVVEVAPPFDPSGNTVRNPLPARRGGRPAQGGRGVSVFRSIDHRIGADEIPPRL
jgi:guanidinopropionase